MDGVYRDMHDTYVRMFDHRPALKGDIDFFLREFEQKRKDREHECLKNASSNIQIIKQNYIPECKQLLDENIPEITAKVAVTVEMCTKIAAKEERWKAGNEQSVLDKAARSTDWVEFMKRQHEKSAHVDKEYQESAQQLKDYYEDLEKKLKLA